MTVILHVTEQLARHGGTPRKLLYLVQHSRTEQVRHAFVTFFRGSLDGDMRAAGATVDVAGTANVVALMRKVYQVARREQASVICTHFTRALVCGVGVARLLRLPVIHNAHGPALERPLPGVAAALGRLASRWSYPGTTLVTANSEYTATTLREVFAVPDDKLRVIPNPVVLRGTPAARRNDAVPPRRPGVLRLVQTGGLIPVRRQHVLIDALAEVQRHGVEAELLMVGDGALKDDLVARSRRLGVESRIHWLGFRDDVGDVLATCDVYVSAIDTEGFGIAVVEAMLQGVPVVLANGGAYPELVDRGRLGVLFDPADPRELAAKIVELSADEARRRALAAAARDHAAHRFEPRRYAETYRELVAEVCGA